jgi:hypothetical protein
VPSPQAADQLSLLLGQSFINQVWNPVNGTTPADDVTAVVNNLQVRAERAITAYPKEQADRYCAVTSESALICMLRALHNRCFMDATRQLVSAKSATLANLVIAHHDLFIS